MPANISSTGPVHLFVRVPATGAHPRGPAQGGVVQYLGTCVEYPKVQIEQKYKDVQNDIGGDEVPFDAFFAGEEASLEMEINRFDYAVLNSISNSPRFNRPGGLARGQSGRLDRGLFALANQQTYELWLRFGFFGTPNVTDAGMIPGYYFYACVTAGHFPDPIGLRDHVVKLAIKPMNWWSAADGAFRLYSTDPADFQALNNVPVT